VTVVGDFNAQLPSAATLNRLWHKNHGFTKHSVILYDFIVGNSMSAVDLYFCNSKSYTFFNHTNGTYSWLDHVLCFNHTVDNVSNCVIVDEDQGNVSDHLPVTVTFSINCESTPKSRVTAVTDFAKPNWSRESRNATYCNILKSRLSDLPPISTDGVSLEDIINDRLSVVNSAIHDATQEAGCLPKRAYKPKAYWCPQLSRLRDRRKCWWDIWDSCGRPRSGTVFDIVKSLKKEFRRVSRINIQRLAYKDIDALNRHFSARKTKSFWNILKKSQRSHIDSCLSADDFADFYSVIMADNDPLDDCQLQVKKKVEEMVQAVNTKKQRVEVSAAQVEKMIRCLKRDVAPGCDQISTEHLLHGLSLELCCVLAEVYSAMLSNGIIPTIFTTGIVIPLLKKPSSDPNIPKNFRPVTLSSAHCKLVELLIAPEDPSCSSVQYGFRPERGTTFVTSFLNDLTAYFNHRGSPLHICGLDAERCFDSIWHDGLLHKLYQVLPPMHWLFLVNWYRNSSAQVKWNKTLSYSFRIAKGMRQGSLLSPSLFNIFINELLEKLRKKSCGASISDFHFTTAAFADDISLVSATVSGLQDLINECCSYAELWRFKFGLEKSQCVTVGPSSEIREPCWRLRGQPMKNAQSLDILGVTFSRDLRFAAHVEKRVSACRRNIFRYSSVGMVYPGLGTNVKSYMWKTIGAPTLLYGMDSIHLSQRDIKQLNSAQGSIVKRVMGLNKRCHHSSLLQAMNIQTIEDKLKTSVSSLYNRIGQVSCPSRDLQSVLLAMYITDGTVVKNTLLDRLVQYQLSPTDTFLCKPKTSKGARLNMCSGLVDSLRYLIYNDNYVKLGSDEHFLTSLMLRSF